MGTTGALEAIKFDKDAIKLEILDQLCIPYQTKYVRINGIEDAYQAIKKMQVRGAPAIAIVGAFAVLVEALEAIKQKRGLYLTEFLKLIEYLITSRPTAVNLSKACNEIMEMISNRFDTKQQISLDVFNDIKNYAISLYEDDLKNNYSIGENGVNYIKKTLRDENFKGPFSIITICNTGSLATSGHGTALGIVRTAFSDLSKDSGEDFWVDHVYPCETRPYNQGSRLTTFELKFEKIPFTLICDNMVASLLHTLTKGRSIGQETAPVKFIIAGADRVVFNGDTANKIGTFQLAAIANHFNSLAEKNTLKFMIAAPRTTVDLSLKSGEDIVIEQRPARELTTVKGPVVENDKVLEQKTVSIATPDINVWNPAFDVTPHELIDAIITEEKPYEKVDGQFNLHDLK